jgi:peptidoglycan/LPS O-acetylase OafA/YrhL
MNRRELDTQQIAFIDALRALAPILVLWAHLGGWYLSARGLSSPLQDFWTENINVPLHLWQDGGYLGVLIFFLVSGFIITHVSLRESQLEYAIKRAFRVLPLFWIAISLVGFLMMLASRVGLPPVLGPRGDTLDYFGTMSFANYLTRGPVILTVGWTLVVELLSYIATLIFIPWSRTKPLTASYALLGLAIAAYFAFVAVPEMQPFVRMFGYTPYLLVGRAFYLGWAKLASPVQASLFGVATFSSFVLMFATTQIVLLQPGNEALVSQLIAIALFAALCFARVPRIAPLSFVAMISYSLYVLHVPVGSFLLDWLILKQHVAYEAALPLVVVMLLGLSWVSYQLLEKPTQSLGRQIIRALGLKRAPPVQAKPTNTPSAL